MCLGTSSPHYLVLPEFGLGTRIRLPKFLCLIIQHHILYIYYVRFNKVELSLTDVRVRCEISPDKQITLHQAQAAISDGSAFRHW